MRIAIPIHSFEPGGVERVALRLAAQWQASGGEVLIVLGRDEGRCRGDAPPLDYRTIREPLPTARWETIWMIWCLFRFLRKERVDVLFCPGNTYTIVCVAMRILLGRRCPPVIVKISNDLQRCDLAAPFRPFYRIWLHIQGAMLDHFVALAEPMLPEIIRELRIDPGRATVIADPALSAGDLERLGRMSPGSGQPSGCHFVSVGRLAPQKNYRLLLDAFALHSWPDDRLTIAGEGPEKSRLTRQAERLGIADRVTLSGHVSDIAALLEQADVFVLSSDYEGVPAVIIEALAAGIPIAATDCCASMPWLLRHGAFGIVAPSGDADAFGLAMNAARYLDPPRERMRRFAAQFTLERASEQYLSAMKGLVDRQIGERTGNLRDKVRDWRERGV